jgi:predicted TPR repeat methyltransferase
MSPTTPPDAPREFDWLTTGATTDSQRIAAYYDQWAQQYDRDLHAWRYDAPAAAACLLKDYAPEAGPILDAGCGTGLTGKALRDQGYPDLTGLDISAESLRLAEQTGAYRQLVQHDLQQTPLPLPADHFDALVCVGVLAHIQDALPLLRDFCRLVRPGGCLLFSQRHDLFAQRDYPSLLERLEREGH